jgi:hypothetical protein
MSRTAVLRDSRDEVRALPIDAEVRAADPDRAGAGSDRFGDRRDAERARRQYDAVEPENRLVARSLEWVWEEKLRRTEQIEQEYDAWRREQGSFDCRHRPEQILALGQNLPALWHAATTTAADRKQIVRLIIKEVALDKKRRRGFVWIRVIWQTGAASEHWAQRTVQSYTAHADADRIRDRIIELNGMNKLDAEIAATFNKVGLRTAHGPDFSGNMIHLLRKRWGIKTVKINRTEANLQPGRMEVARFARLGEGQGAELVKDNEVLPIRIIRQTPLPSTAALGAG